MKKKATVKKPTAPTTLVVGHVTPRERDEIQQLHERKMGLNELVVALQQNPAVLANEAFYEKLVTDAGKTAARMQRWWNEKSKAYGWQSAPDGHWTIDFETCDIFLNR